MFDVDVKADQGIEPDAVKLITKHCIDALFGNLGSLIRLLNSSAYLEQIKLMVVLVFKMSKRCVKP